MAKFYLYVMDCMTNFAHLDEEKQYAVDCELLDTLPINAHIQKCINASPLREFINPFNVTWDVHRIKQDNQTKDISCLIRMNRGVTFGSETADHYQINPLDVTIFNPAPNAEDDVDG